MDLALAEINAAGGVLGRPLEIVSRDDNGTPGDAVRVAEELLTRENVSFLAGTFLSNVGLAVADFANQRKTLFLATEPLTDAITMPTGSSCSCGARLSPPGAPTRCAPTPACARSIWVAASTAVDRRAMPRLQQPIEVAMGEVAVLQVEGLDAAYGQAQVLFDVSLTLARGEIVALMQSLAFVRHLASASRSAELREG